MSATVFRFKPGTVGASMAHMEYISRQTAVLDDVLGVVMRNIPESVREARNYRELRENLACYAWAREKSEIAQYKSKTNNQIKGKGKKEVRTHYRIMASFEKDVDTEKIKQMMNEWLESKLPTARACGFIHRDTDHTHVHIWVDARKISGEKIHLGSASYKSLDKEWNRIYSKEMGRPEKDYLDRIERNKQEKTLKRELSKLLVKEQDKGNSLSQANRQVYVERENRNTGVKEIDKERIRGDKRQIASPVERGQEREPATNQATRASRTTEPRDSRGEGSLRRASDLARARTEELRREDIAFREREATVATRQEFVRATDREMETAIQSTDQAVRECKQLEQGYEQTIERRYMERELAKAYEQDILAMDREYEQAVQRRDMEQGLSTAKVQVQDYEQDMLAMDMEYNQAIERTNMQQELDKEEFEGKKYEKNYGSDYDRDDYDEPSR